MKPQTKEQLIYYLLQNISLGTYDKRFLNNLQGTNLIENRPLTSNQATLLDKITLHYFKQLRRKEIDANEMVNLPWTLEPIDSLPEYTDAFCIIKDDIIEVRAPYKKDFIADIKKCEVILKWNVETKTWSGVYCEAVLKHMIECLDNHFQIVRYCDRTVEIINSFAEYEEATCWDPTLMLINDNLMIAGINNGLHEAIKDIPLSTSPETIAKLMMYGVQIDPSLIEPTNKLATFAMEHTSVRDYTEIEETIKDLKQIGCDFILVAETTFGSGNKYIDRFKEACESQNVEYSIRRKSIKVEPIDTKGYNYPVLINTGLWSNEWKTKLYAAKIVNFGNNKPINIK